MIKLSVLAPLLSTAAPVPVMVRLAGVFTVPLFKVRPLALRPNALRSRVAPVPTVTNPAAVMLLPLTFSAPLLTFRFPIVRLDVSNAGLPVVAVPL